MTQRSLTIRGIPDEMLARLRARAAASHRSLNGELLAILAAAAESDDGASSGAQSAAHTSGGARGNPTVREPAAAYAPGGTAGIGGTRQPQDFRDEVDRTALAAACRRHNIRWLAVFGSWARGEARPDSDVDVVAEFEPGKTPGLGIVRVAEALRPLFGGRPVDLVTRRGLAPRLRARVLAEAKVLHAAG
jgi:uncharacterized protein